MKVTDKVTYSEARKIVVNKTSKENVFYVDATSKKSNYYSRFGKIILVPLPSSIMKTIVNTMPPINIPQFLLSCRVLPNVNISSACNKRN